MKTIVLATQKGGSGKTSLCVSLAVAAQEEGHSVFIVELDAQGSATAWYQDREEDFPEVRAIPTVRLEQVIQKLEENGCDYVFIDTPGAETPGVKAAMRMADFVLIPCRPSPADLKSVPVTIAEVMRLGLKFGFVGNQTTKGGSRLNELMNSLRLFGMISPTPVRYLMDHQDAFGAGLGVTEFDPKGEAAYDVRRLWKWVTKQIGETEYDESEAQADDVVVALRG